VDSIDSRLSRLGVLARPPVVVYLCKLNWPSTNAKTFFLTAQTCLQSPPMEISISCKCTRTHLDSCKSSEVMKRHHLSDAENRTLVEPLDHLSFLLRALEVLFRPIIPNIDCFFGVSWRLCPQEVPHTQLDRLHGLTVRANHNIDSLKGPSPGCDLHTCAHACVYLITYARVWCHAGGHASVKSVSFASSMVSILLNIVDLGYAITVAVGGYKCNSLKSSAHQACN
jgi:hypothetical protein